MRLLIDTNVILDACLGREPWNIAAEKLILACAEEKINGYITASSVTDIHYILRKALQNDAQARHEVQKIITILGVLDVNASDCEKALSIPMKDYEDALLACCGKRHRVDYIVTRDNTHFQGSPIKTIFPDEW